jgi:hypothetical protein
MNLLLRVLRFFVLLAFSLLGNFLAFLARFLLLPMLLAVLRVLRDLIFISLAATVNGPAQYRDRLAAQWTGQIIHLGADRNWLDRIYIFCQFIVGSAIVLGWSFSILFTVLILRVVFGFFI